VAGAGKAQKTELPRILEAVRAAGVDYEIHRTTNAGEATLWVRRRLANAPETEMLRFYAVGGDGTLAEVLNGLYGAENAELACIPIGSGNDFVRNFGGASGGEEHDPFLRVGAQIQGEAVPVDVMEFQFFQAEDEDADAGKPEDAGAGMDRLSESGAVRYAINMLNIGFDAKVVAHTQHLKKTRVLRGTAAYVAGVVTELAAYRPCRAQVKIGGNQPFDTPILLAGVGNGRFSGGGFMGLPTACVDDGLLDVSIIHSVSRLEFLRLVGKYHAGTHTDDPLLVGRIFQWQARQVSFTPVGPLTLSVDGEPVRTQTPFRIRLAEKPVRFALPAGVCPLKRTADEASEIVK